MKYVIPLLLLIAGCAQTEQPEQPQKKQVVSQPKLTAFTATWCGACRADKPELEQLLRQGVLVRIVDVDQNPDLVEKYGITSIPVYFACTSKGCLRTQEISKAKQWLLGTNAVAEAAPTKHQEKLLPRLSLRQKLRLSLLKLVLKRKLSDCGDGLVSVLKPVWECCVDTPIKVCLAVQSTVSKQ